MPSDRPGLVLDGRYELIEEVGHGGMAVVWLAQTRGAAGFRRPVAIKRIDDSCKGFPEIEAMFVEEARVGAALRHPNIVQIHDFGVDENGDHYMVSEWVEGIHLGDYVRSFDKKPTPWPLIAAIGVEVLRALDAAHSRRDAQGRLSPILHRDVNPPNILLDVHGVVKLADFGMARAMDRTRTTQPDMLKGKLSYMAPEMLTGMGPSVQSDLFGLGVVLWEALTAARLFDAPTDIDVLHMLREARVPMLSMKRGDLPMGLTSVVHRALQREPQRRYSSAREMMRAMVRELRVLPDSTDSLSLGQSVAEARARLAADKNGGG